MANTIITKNSSTASAVPTAGDLVQGELAVNVTDKRLFTEDAGGNIVEIGTNPSTINIDAGTIDGTAIGGTTPTTGAFTTLSASTSVTSPSGLFTNLSASGSVTLSGGTANAVAFLNGSKVLTSGSALTFDGSTLNITGTATMDGLTVDGEANIGSSGTQVRINSSSTTGIIELGGGTTDVIRSSAATDGLRFDSGGPYKRLIIANNGDISFYNSSGFSQAFFWDASAESLGIGTSSPTNKLTVSGNANITGNTTLGDASTDTVTVNGYMGVGVAPNAAIGIYANPSSLTGTGQYGVAAYVTSNSAATTETVALVAQGATAAAAYTTTNLYGIKLNNATKGAGSTITSQHGVYIADQTQGTNNYGITSLVSSGTNKWNIYASGSAANYFAGNVGIGTSSPQKQLEVKGSSATSEIRLSNSTAVYSNIYSDSNGILILAADGGGTGGAASMRMSVSGSERLRIDSSGNVGIGTSSPGDKIELGGNGSGIIIRSPNGTRYRLTVTDLGVLSIAAA